ncbi:MAG TPA: VCBS repeat-containing protein [Planctomycetota bacterium]|nr:VCBS repeat-containing protein [Planctomycetota bacterium]
MQGLAVGWAFAVAVCSGCRTAAEPAFVEGPDSPIAVGPGPETPALADFDGDGRPDIVVTCGSRAAPQVGGVLLLLNQGGARFAAAPAGRIELPQPVDSLAVADFNEDRCVDVAAVGHDSYQVHLLFGDGHGGLSGGSSFAAHVGHHPHTHAVAALDVNGDGHADVLTTNADDDAISVLLGDGRGGLAPAAGSPFAAPRHPYSSLAVQDLDGDGRPDVAAPLLESGEIGVYLGDGAGGFAAAPGSPHGVGARPGFVHADDVNGDGRPDLLATHDDVGLLDVLLNEGGGRFAFAPESPVRVREPVWSIVTSDVDDDGDRDAILSTPGRSLVLLLGDGHGGFSRAERAALATGEAPNRLASGDLDGDGRADVVTSNHESGDITVLLRR